MNALWGLGHMMMLTRVLVIVDADIDVHDVRETCLVRAEQSRARARRRDDAGTGRRSRSRLVHDCVRNEDRHRCDAQERGRRVHARVAAGHGDGSENARARRASAGASTDSTASRPCSSRIPGAVEGSVKSVALFLREIRIEHTLFALPFAYVGAVLAAHGLPSLWAILWITLAVLGARTAAMAANRYSRSRDRCTQSAHARGAPSPAAASRRRRCSGPRPADCSCCCSRRGCSIRSA